MVRAVLLASAVAVAKGAQWAVLAAGSQGYENYRHQADLCHGYQVLLEKGFDPDHIITLSYDDVANDEHNPFPGQLFNKPTSGPGKDVYAGCKIDYRGSECSATNFLDVLTGQGSGKVLKSSSQDHVFVSFYDHGGVGIIAFPGGFLHVQDMQAAFTEMHSKGMYKKLTFYMEACESGSMFQGMNIPGIYAVSAANAEESSWGCYCGSQAIVDGKPINSCLGDLFSVNWMENSDATDITQETLSAQFDIVKSKTNLSHVMQWSDTSFTSDDVSDFLGNTGTLTMPTLSDAEPTNSAWSVRELELRQAYDYYTAATKGGSRLQAGAELQALLQSQLNAEKSFEKFLNIIYPGDYARQAAARDGSALPENPQCEIAVRENFIKYGKFDASSGFAMQFQRYIVNVCADNSHNVDVVDAAKQACMTGVVV